MHNAEASINIFDSENWERMGKFIGVQLAVGIVVVIICYLAIYFLIAGGIAVGGLSSSDNLRGMIGGAVGGMMLAFLFILVAVVCGQMFALGWYESWRGCELA